MIGFRGLFGERPLPTTRSRADAGQGSRCNGSRGPPRDRGPPNYCKNPHSPPRFPSGKSCEARHPSLIYEDCERSSSRDAEGILRSTPTVLPPFRFLFVLLERFNYTPLPLFLLPRWQS